MPRVFGQDTLFLQKKGFGVPALIKAAAGMQVDATGNLDITSGAKLLPIRSMLQALKPKYHRVHFWNTTCNRNNVCQDYEPTYGYSMSALEKAILNKNPELLKRLKKRTIVYREFSKDFPDVIFLASPALEHNLGKPAWRVIADVVHEAWPEVQLVNNPMAGGAAEKYLGAWIERHGHKESYLKDAEIVSTDGIEVTDILIPEFKALTKGNEITFGWSRVDNCRDQGDDFDPPKERTSCPNKDQFELLLHIFDDRPKKPTYTGEGDLTEFASPMIWKPFAEDEGTGDVRANYPVAIVPMKANKSVQVVDRTGKSIGALGYFGTFSGNLKRYYSKWAGGSELSGYRFEKAAMASSGSPWAYLKQGNKVIGPFLGGMRNGKQYP